MRVGFDCAPLALSTAGELRYARALLAALHVREDVEVAPLTMSLRRPSEFRHRLAWQAAAEALYYPLLIGPQARRAGVDLVHHPRHLVPPELGLTVPSVVTIHDVLALTAPEHFSRLISARFGLLARIAAHRAALVITGSSHSRDAIAEQLDVAPDRVRVTPYAVDERFAPVEPDPERVAAVLGVAGPCVRAVVGTVEPRKNLVGAIRAFERVQDRFPDHRLVAVGGSGWKSGPIERELAQTSARVHTPGYVEDEHLPLVYSSAEAFLFPSFGEGFGFPVLEAMACGTPVLTSNLTSLPELVADAAVLVDPRSTEAVAEALAGLLESPTGAPI